MYSVFLPTSGPPVPHESYLLRQHQAICVFSSSSKDYIRASIFHYKEACRSTDPEIIECTGDWTLDTWKLFYYFHVCMQREQFPSELHLWQLIVEGMPRLESGKSDHQDAGTSNDRTAIDTPNGDPVRDQVTSQGGLLFNQAPIWAQILSLRFVKQEPAQIQKFVHDCAQVGNLWYVLLTIHCVNTCAKSLRTSGTTESLSNPLQLFWHREGLE